ncbi:superoxide dismutase, Ni [Shewanella maritima]|uniref:Superoxide dismutase, Ni n=1 Tax=Shewanella maritima TaxID=2520507 RepID=A0A411PIH4_9GAMM|nr:superoxide dismutase, Ni [Shewanella maritima]QBF83274.1 superoxide dismutase, Ni [Shewanella maritima]
MMYKLLAKLDAKKPFNRASAHCDIPCKIYDPSAAQIAVLSMIRMVDLLDELTAAETLTTKQQATFARLVNEKEAEGKKVKEEVLVIWGDYFKKPQLEAFPEIHQLTHEIMLATSFAKQHIDRAATVELLNKVNRFADIFWQTKGVNTYTATCPYPPAEQVIYPDLKG